MNDPHDDAAGSDPGAHGDPVSAILVVDHNPRNLALLSPFLERAGYRARAAASLEEVDQLLNRGELPDLAVVDLAGFDRGIWERCEHLRQARVPIIAVSPVQSATVQQESRMHGARAVLIRPLIMKHLLELIHSLIGS